MIMMALSAASVGWMCLIAFKLGLAFAEGFW